MAYIHSSPKPASVTMTFSVLLSDAVPVPPQPAAPASDITADSARSSSFLSLFIVYTLLFLIFFVRKTFVFVPPSALDAAAET